MCSLSFILYITTLGISLVYQIFLFKLPQTILHSKCLTISKDLDFENCRSAKLRLRRIFMSSSADLTTSYSSVSVLN